jgi:hypothetical protein
MRTKSQIHLSKILLIAICIIIIIPISIWVTMLLINRPAVNLSAPAEKPLVINQDINAPIIINSLLTLQYTRPNDSWSHLVVSTKTDEYRARSMTLELKNTQIKILLDIQELALGLNRQAVTIDKITKRAIYDFNKYEESGAGTQTIKIKDKDYTLKTSSNNTYILLDPSISNNKKILSTLDLFPEYNENNKNYKIITNIKLEIPNNNQDNSYLPIVSKILSSLTLQ